MLSVHPSGFYAWVKEPLSQRAQEDRRQTKLVKQAWKDSGKVYGYHKFYDDLIDMGEVVSENRVARLARIAGVQAQIGYKKKPGVYGGKPSVVVDNTLDRQLAVDAPDRAWVTDITYLRTREGFAYLCVAKIGAAEGQGAHARHLAGRNSGRRNRRLQLFFVDAYGVKWDKAVAKPVKDRDALLTFYDYPAEHWKHIRTSNPIESTFATVRHRTKRTKGCLRRKTGLAMAFRLMMSAQTKWRKLDGRNRMPEVINGVEFRDDVRHIQAAA
ncbi:Transposase, Mutator family [Aquimixticola soesokkakensis]|uniref:Transposase, Mutator family n=1 Tax=Aquimixticola soesokkakensis TaxID=1519096 RepID=A0A1Y5TQM7_9RHOB|nr:Transposase, Mutator family [Aquimixticola soesokkakensis]